MDPKLITLILNVAFAAFLTLGFLFGLRGVKKATSSVVTFVVNLLVVLLLSPIVSRAVLNIPISGSTINQRIISFVNDMLGESMASSETVQEVVKNIPLLVVNIVVSILLIFICGFILKIIGSIVYRLIFGKDKVKEVEECQIVNGTPTMVKRTVKPSKHRLLGGFIGLLHGALLIFVLLFPIIGLVNIYTDIAGMDNSASAESSVSMGNFEIEPLERLLQNNVPDNVNEYVKAVDNSVLCKVAKVTKMGELSLNIVSRCDINGQTVRLGNEIRSFAKTYDTFVDFVLSSTSDLTDYTVKNVINDMAENPDNYKFDKLYDTVDALFESKLVVALGNDALKFAVEMVDTNELESDSFTKSVVDHVKVAINNYANNEYSLKDDFRAMLGVFETTVKSGLLNELRSGEISIENVKNILINEENEAENIPENKVLCDLVTKITSSNFVQKVALEATNIGLEQFQKIINDELLEDGQQKITLTFIDSAKPIKFNASELQNIAVYAFKIYDTISGISLDDIKNDMYVVFDVDASECVRLLGREIATIMNMEVFKDTGVLSDICVAMNNTSYSKYVDFVELNNHSNIVGQFDNIANSVQEIVDSGIVVTLKNMNDGNKDQSIDDIIDKLAVTKEDKTYANRIVSPVLRCTTLKKIFELALESANDTLKEGIKVLNEDATLGEFNTKNLLTERENEEILSIVDNLVMYAKDVSIADLKTADGIKDVIINSDLTLLGNALDSISNATLFSGNDDTSGVYADMIDALKSSSLSDIFLFDAALGDGFTWNGELSKVKNLINDLNSIMVDGEGLVKYTMNGGDVGEVYNVLKSESDTKVKKIQPIFEINLIRPLGIKLVNEINGKIKDFAGALGDAIIEYTNTRDISGEAEQITNVLVSALKLDMDSVDIDTIDVTKINNVLDSLQANAESNGVFTNSYNAFLLKTTVLINENVKGVVGADVGKNIVTEVSSTLLLVDVASDIRGILNGVAGKSSEFSTIDLANLNATKLNSFIDLFKMTKNKSKQLFDNTYNALLVYMVNQINGAIYDSCNISGYVDYDGDENLTTYDGEVKLLISRACECYSMLEGNGIENLPEVNRNQLLNALGGIPQTQNTKTILEDYINSQLGL